MRFLPSLLERYSAESAAAIIDSAVTRCPAEHAAPPESVMRTFSGSLSLGFSGNSATALRSFNAMGDAVNVAARLETVAQPGQVVIGESTRSRLPVDAVVEPLGELAVKGRRGGVVAFRLAGLHRASV